jgi:hypothetical protein
VPALRPGDRHDRKNDRYGRRQRSLFVIEQSAARASNKGAKEEGPVE